MRTCSSVTKYKMKSLYLILFAATAVVVTCKPQRSNNDIIWYPIDDEEGIFVSVYGEKQRTLPNYKPRSHRRPRYSGTEIPGPRPLFFDTKENEDPSFFHDINERRTFSTVLPIPKLPPSFQNEQNPASRPMNRPQTQKNENYYETNFQEIVNEVFGFDPNEYQFGRPGMNSQWGSKPGTQNQWGDIQQRPSRGNQWDESGPFFPPKRPATSDPWATTSRPASTKKPTKRPHSTSTKPNKQNNQSDKLVFPDEDSNFTTTTPSNLVPTDPPTMSPCERLCPVTPEFNPVCGSDGATYSNAGRLKCARICGKDVTLSHYGNCGRGPLVTPLLSGLPKPKAFW